jgi:uncharacterized membrane protein
MYVDQRESPSAWRHRLPVVALALVGCGISTYLTLYQWHVLQHVWDAVFGAASSEAVLTSFISHWLPVPDATLGALAYALEAVLGVLGGRDRWRTNSPIVLVFGLVVVGTAVVGLVLVGIQAFAVHAFCSLCLCSAAISWLNAWLSHDEILAGIARSGADLPNLAWQPERKMR